MTALKPCPWPQCRGEARTLSDLLGAHFCACEKCGARGPEATAEAAAIAAWNTRALTPAEEAAGELVEALESQADYHERAAKIELCGGAFGDAVIASAHTMRAAEIRALLAKARGEASE